MVLQSPVPGFDSRRRLQHFDLVKHQVSQGGFRFVRAGSALPRFGAYRLGRLPAGEIENWLNDEIAAGLAPSLVHRHYRTLRRVLQVAVEKEKIPSNPCDRVQPPRVPKREMVFLTWEQAVDLAEAVGERYRALIYLAVDSGMRWSELVGLAAPRSTSTGARCG